MQLLLATDDGLSSRAAFDAEEEGGGGGGAGAAMELAGRLRAQREEVGALRAQIADAYAESLGSDPECQVQ